MIEVSINRCQEYKIILYRIVYKTRYILYIGFQNVGNKKRRLSRMLMMGSKATNFEAHILPQDSDKETRVSPFYPTNQYIKEEYAKELLLRAAYSGFSRASDLLKSLC